MLSPPRTVPESTYASLRRAEISLGEAVRATDASQRYSRAHVAALQATAALLAARAQPAPPRARRGTARQRNAWVLLTQLAPELSEWASFFAAGAAKRAAAEAGAPGAVTEREANDLVRQADQFLRTVEESLGVWPHRQRCDQLPACTVRLQGRVRV